MTHPIIAPPLPAPLPSFGLPLAAPQAAVPTAAATLSPDQKRELVEYAMGGPKTQLALHYPWLTHAFAAFFLISALLLILLLALQTPRQESLGGGIGGREAFRPRYGLEGQLARLTQGVATLFIVSATLVSISGI